MLRILLLSTAVGGALGAFLDRGLAVLLPCAPWPEPMLSGWGWLVGAAQGVVAGLVVRACAVRGTLAPPPPGAVARALAGGIAFTCAATVMVGAIGYVAGRRASLERDTVRMREARKDLDKKLVPRAEAEKRIAEIEASMATPRDPARAHASTRRAATVAGSIAAWVAAAFAGMAVVYRRALATRDQPV